VGGQLTDLVVSGQLAYVATGRVVAVWDFSDPSAPVQVGATDEPATALISGLALHGDHLYASWQAGNDQGGVTIYSLADPAQPVLVNDIAIDALFSNVNAVAAANDHLYLFDSENGIWVSSLADPEAPTLTARWSTPTRSTPSARASSAMRCSRPTMSRRRSRRRSCRSSPRTESISST
jgi:hypothetical protein